MKINTTISASIIISIFQCLTLHCVSYAEKPNVLLILADDLGYMDIGAYAQKASGTPTSEQFFETPNIDRLIGSGTAFSQAYACALCAPTRSSILTGRYAPRIGFTTAVASKVHSYYNQNQDPPQGYLAQDAIYWGDKIDAEQALWNGSTLLALPSGTDRDSSKDEKTLAEALNEGGYHSAFIGKWHLGGHGSSGYQPHDQGFEELAYFDSGGSPYFDWKTAWTQHELYHDSTPQDRLHVGKFGTESGESYLTDHLTVQANEFLREHSAKGEDQPFFLYLCHFALHTPFEAKEAYEEHFRGKETKGWNNHSNATYAAMVKSLDDSIGSIISTLEATGELENTIIIFMSDNGGVSWPTDIASLADESRGTSNAPLKGGKAMLFEGGIRVPLFFYWKDKITRNRWVDRVVDCNDIYPTILDLVQPDLINHSTNPIDGQSLKEFLTESKSSPSLYDRDTFYWHYPFNVVVNNPEDGMPLTPQSAIRKGDYKLIYDWSGRLFLYNIAEDISESFNLAEREPELVQSMFTDLNQWLNTNVEGKYFPTRNPDYDPSKDARPYPFVDLRKKYLGETFSIKPKPDHAKKTVEHVHQKKGY